MSEFEIVRYQMINKVPLYVQKFKQWKSNNPAFKRKCRKSASQLEAHRSAPVFALSSEYDFFLFFIVLH